MISFALALLPSCSVTFSYEQLTVQASFVHPSRFLAAGPTERQFQAILDHAELLGVIGQRPRGLLCVCILDESRGCDEDGANGCDFAADWTDRPLVLCDGCLVLAGLSDLAPQQ